MKGEKIKEILKSEGFSISEVARLLGFDNDQRLHSALRSEDVKTGLVEEIARVTNRSVCLFFGTLDSKDSSNHSVIVSAGNVQSSNIKGNGNNVNSSDEVVGKIVNELSASRDVVLRTLNEVATQSSIVGKTISLLEKRDTQIDRLISILENKS